MTQTQRRLEETRVMVRRPREDGASPDEVDTVDEALDWVNARL